MTCLRLMQQTLLIFDKYWLQSQNKRIKKFIDWFQSISDIDSQPYAKYCLTGDETVFIEKVIKPME